MKKLVSDCHGDEVEKQYFFRDGGWVFAHYICSECEMKTVPKVVGSLDMEKLKKPSSKNAEQARKSLIKMGHTHLMTQEEILGKLYSRFEVLNEEDEQALSQIIEIIKGYFDSKED